MKITNSEDIRGGIILLGRGTVKNEILNLLGIKSQKREVVNILLEKEKADELLDFYAKELQLDEAGHGIAYTTSVIIANQTIGENRSDICRTQSMEG